MTYLNGAEDERAEHGRQREPKLKLTDDEFLMICRAERRNAIGMEPGDFILEEREQALEYYKGQMDDVPSLPGRSKVVSSDISDAVQTALPDLIEIFIGGEEIGSFRPLGEEDVEAAKQETEVVNSVIMHENDGFALVHDAIHDALLTKVGVFHFWAEEDERDEEETFERATAVDIQLAMQQAEIVNVEEMGADDMSGEPLYRFTARKKYAEKCVKVDTVAPEDFSVARDTKRLRDGTYACMRMRPRAQDLKERGFDPELVDSLPVYSAAMPQLVDQARDLAGEHRIVTSASDATHDLRTVLIYKHVVRVDADGDGETELWQITTDEHETALLEKVRLTAMPFSAGSPFRAPHRFYGRSLADLLIEVQRIKTALMRLTLDSAFFAINQRHEVVETTSTENTISDLLNNQPGMPVRVRQAGTVTPIPAGQLGFDPFAALEYVATVSEQRTGIVRNAQGLNPDTLHETAKGALALMSAAQRRLRLIARTLAETMFKDLFVGVHTLLREHGSEQMTTRIRGKFVQVDPTSWGVRKDMVVEIGMGGGQQNDLLLLEGIKQDMMAIVEAQANGAVKGEIVTAKNMYALARRRAEAARMKGVAEFYTDPEENPQPEQEPQPDPAMAKVQADAMHNQQKLQLQAAESQATHQRTTEETQAKLQLQREESQLKLSLMREEAAARIQVMREEQQNKQDIALQQMQADAVLAERKMQQEYELERLRIESAERVGQARAQASSKSAPTVDTDVNGQ